MFNDGELKSLLRYVDMYHESPSELLKERAIKFITLKIQDKLPGASMDKILEIVKEFHPEIKLDMLQLDDFPTSGTEPQESSIPISGSATDRPYAISRAPMNRGSFSDSIIDRYRSPLNLGSTTDRSYIRPKAPMNLGSTTDRTYAIPRAPAYLAERLAQRAEIQSRREHIPTIIQPGVQPDISPDITLERLSDGPPKAGLVVPPVVPTLELWRIQRDRDREDFSRRTRGIASGIDSFSGGLDSLHNLEIQLADLENSRMEREREDEIMASQQQEAEEASRRRWEAEELLTASRRHDQFLTASRQRKTAEEVSRQLRETDEFRMMSRQRELVDRADDRRRWMDEIRGHVSTPSSILQRKYLSTTTIPDLPPEWLNGAERECYRSMTEGDRILLVSSYDKMKKTTEEHDSYPLRIQVLMSGVPDSKKMEIFNRLDTAIPGLGEGGKYLTWVNSVITIPFDKSSALPCTSKDANDVFQYLTECRATFDKEVYGHDRVKNEFLSMVGSWIKLGNTNPHGNVIGVTGPIGVGKTTLIKEGLSRALQRPFYFISLGGTSYSSFLQGHGYTYEGSTYGEIARGLIETKCMDPVFYFDELDKVAMDSKGEEIIHALIHLTDPAQNTSFGDRYFAGIDLDVSRALFVFSYNDREKVNPILRDRIHEIALKDFSLDEKAEIARQYILPKLTQGMGIVQDDLLIFEDKTIEHLVELSEQKTGMRSLKTVLIRLLRILNVASLTDGKLILNIDEKYVVGKGPYQASKEMIEELFRSSEQNEDESSSSMMYI